MYNNPTTEIFDHGCDTVSCAVIAVATLACMRPGANLHIGVLTVLSCWSLFYVETWEMASVGVMRFPQGPLNPTEGLLAVQTALLATAAYPGLWQQSVLWISLGNLVAIAAAALSLKASVSVVTRCLNMERASATELLPMACTVALTLLLDWTGCLAQRPWHTLLCAAGSWTVASFCLIEKEIFHRPRANVLLALSGQVPVVMALLWPAKLGTPVLVLAATIAVNVAVFSRVVSSVCSALDMSHFWQVPSKPQQKSN
jgi:hypothetical protein